MKSRIRSMVLKLLLSSLVVLINTGLFAQFQQEWVERYFTYGNSDDEAHFVETDVDNNIYVLGESMGDIVLIKYTPNGDEIWNARFNSDPYNGTRPADMHIGQDGNIYVLGSTKPGSTGAEFITIKYDTSGAVLWQDVYSWGTSYNTPVELTTDFQNNIVFVGVGSTSVNDEAIITVKYDNTGSMQWTAVIDSPFTDVPVGVEIDNLGNIYVAGTTDINSFYSGIIVTKYSAAGNEIWNTRYVGLSSINDVAVAMAIDANSNIYVTGHTTIGAPPDILTLKLNHLTGGIIWEVNFSSPNSIADEPADIIVDEGKGLYIGGTSWGVSGTMSDLLLLHLDFSGNLIWDQRIDQATEADSGMGLALAPNGNISIMGKVKSQFANKDFLVACYSDDGVLLWSDSIDGSGNGYDFPGEVVVDGNGNTIVTGTILNQAGDLDFWSVKYDTIGDTVFSASYLPPSTNNFKGRAVTLDDLGNVYVTGEISTLNDGYDYGTIKYDSQGNLLWVANYNTQFNASDDDYALNIAVDESYNVYVTGHTASNNWTPWITTIKYNPEGIEQWVHIYDDSTAYISMGYNIEVDYLGNTYVCGAVKNSSSSTDPWSSLLIKIDSNGILIWDILFGLSGSSAGSQRALLEMDNAGYLYVGYSDMGQLGVSKVSPGGTIIWTENWQHYYGSEYLTTSVYDIYTDGNGNSYLTGVSNKNGSSPTRFAFTLKYNANGVLIWEQVYPSVGYTWHYTFGHCVTADDAGYTYTLATSDGNNLGPWYHLIKHGLNGTIEWVDSIYVNYGYNLYINEDISPVAIEILTDGKILIAGTDSGNYKLWLYNPSGVLLDVETYAYDKGEDGKEVLTGFEYHPTGGLALTGYSNEFQDYYSMATVKYSPCPWDSLAAHFTHIVDDSNVQFYNSTMTGTQWEWDFGDGTSSTTQSPVHVYSDTGSYDVCLIASNGCGSDAICQTVNIVQISTGIEALSPEHALQIYPNPATNQITLSNIPKGSIRITLYNSMGELVIRQDMVGAEVQIIDLSTFPNGLFLIEVDNSQGKFSKKVIKVLSR